MAVVVNGVLQSSALVSNIKVIIIMIVVKKVIIIMIILYYSILC